MMATLYVVHMPTVNKLRVRLTKDDCSWVSTLVLTTFAKRVITVARFSGTSTVFSSARYLLASYCDVVTQFNS